MSMSCSSEFEADHYAAYVVVAAAAVCLIGQLLGRLLSILHAQLSAAEMPAINNRHMQSSSEVQQAGALPAMLLHGCS